MSCTHELIKGLVQVNAGIAGSGSAVNIESLFPVGGPFESFDEITVFNDTDRPIQVAWTNDTTSGTDFFFVPHGGKSFTHQLNKGGILYTSLKVYSSGNTIATGNITINLAKNRK